MRKIIVTAVLAIIASLGAAASPAGASHTESGYWMLTADGRVFGFGGAAKYGDGTVVSYKKVDIEATPSGHGYWVVNSIGTVEAMGDAEWLGGGGADVPLVNGEKVVSMSASPSGKGYWLFTDKGRVFAFGDAKHFGDMAGVALNGPVLGSVATPSGKGYWMVASDGGVFSFGDAKFYGSMGGTRLNKPVMSLAPDPDGVGYWLVASDGGIFAFEAPFFGSTGSLRLNKPITGMVGQPGGYLMVAEDGGIFAFGDVDFHGSLGATPPSSPVVAVAAIGNPGPPPVMQFAELFRQSSSGSKSTTPFALTTDVAKLKWACGQASSHTAGCNFVVRDLRTGSQLDYVSGDQNQSGEKLLHPEEAGWYYVDVSEFSSASDTTWTVVIEQQRCVANCGAGEPPTPEPVQFSQVFSQSGSGTQSTNSFQLAQRVGKFSWTCGQASSSTAGCNFVIKDFRTGSQVDYVSADSGQSGSMFFHPDSAQSYYVEISEFSSASDTAWSVVIEQ